MIEGIKLIKHNAGRVDEPDDPSYPFRLDAIFRPPEFMTMAFIGLYGGHEEIVVRGKTKEVLEEFIRINSLALHPRLIRMTITQPKLGGQDALKASEQIP